MRRKPILVEAQWFTTTDLARAIERSPRGATWIADREQLECTRTPTRQRLYRKADVLRLVERRTEARLRNVRALRPRKYGVDGEPRQLSLWGPRRAEPLRGPDADFTTRLGSTSRGFVP
jgi:hypothetical protein